MGRRLLAVSRKLSPWRRSSSLNDFSRLNTCCADSDLFDHFSYQGPNILQVRLEDPLGFIVGMADQISDLTPLAANSANLCHWIEILSKR